MLSLAMSMVRVLQALSRATALWAVPMARVLCVVRRLAVPLVMLVVGVLQVMLWGKASLVTLMVRVLRRIGGTAGGADGEAVVGDVECGGAACDAPDDGETGDADGGGAAGGVMGGGDGHDTDGGCAAGDAAGDERAAGGGRCRWC